MRRLVGCGVLDKDELKVNFCSCMLRVMNNALIGHVDADCFYVSCERVRAPALCGQPVGVLGNQGACVIAKSYEMKRSGVATGTPIWEAVKCCPEGIYIKRDFRWYEVISRMLLNILHEVSPTVEYYSIDEMFFRAEQLPQVFGKPLVQAVQALQQRVLHEVLVPVSIGISLSKTLAKLGSDTAKPFGCTVLLEMDKIQNFLRDRPVEEISGIGERSRQKLAVHGIVSCWDFAQADRKFLRWLLTIKGEQLWWELHGDPVLPILTQRPPHKCLGRGGSLGEATVDRNRLTAWVIRNIERLVEELDYHEVFTERLALFVEFKEGGGWGRSMALPEATARFDILVAAAKHILEEACRSGQRVSGMHLLAERLSYRRLVQGNLFASHDPRSERIAAAKRFVNENVGRFAVRSGETLFLPDVYADEANDYDVCDVHGKICF